MTTTTKQLPAGISIVLCSDGDDSCASTWLEARNQKGEVLMESKSIKGSFRFDSLNAKVKELESDFLDQVHGALDRGAKA